MNRFDTAMELQCGGSWLGAARSWLQSNIPRGDSLTWGSDEEVRLTVKQIEALALHVAAAAVTDDVLRIAIREQK